MREAVYARGRVCAKLAVCRARNSVTPSASFETLEISTKVLPRCRKNQGKCENCEKSPRIPRIFFIIFDAYHATAAKMWTLCEPHMTLHHCGKEHLKRAQAIRDFVRKESLLVQWLYFWD